MPTVSKILTQSARMQSVEEEEHSSLGWWTGNAEQLVGLYVFQTMLTRAFAALQLPTSRWLILFLLRVIDEL